MTNYDRLKEYEAHKEPLPSYDEYKRLQEQLNDANDIIDFYFPKIKKINSICIEPLKLYRKKWGVK